MTVPVPLLQVAGLECAEPATDATSKWITHNTRVKLEAVQMMKRSSRAAKKKIESTQDFSASAELDKIKSISKWLSIKVLFIGNPCGKLFRS